MCTPLLSTRFAWTPSAPWQGELAFFITTWTGLAVVVVVVVVVV
jgi:hypothetical protein